MAIAAVDGPGQAWLNYDRFSHPVTYAKSTDPLAQVTDSWHARTTVPAGGTWDMRTPPNVRIAAGSDAHMHVVTPDRMFVQEHWSAAKVAEGQYSTKRRHLVSLYGSGIGPQNGTRAYGGSAIAGLIRAWEVDPQSVYYTGTIDHPLAVALRPDQIWAGDTVSPNEGYGPYTSDGYGRRNGYVWPATEGEAGTGPIPLGSYFAIPPWVDLNSLGLKSQESLMIARAAQDYGVYVVDSSGSSTFYLEDDGGAATRAFQQRVVGPPVWDNDVRRIFKAMKIVTSNGSDSPNGGPLGSSRRRG